MSEQQNGAATPLTREAAAVAGAAAAAVSDGTVVRLAETAEKMGAALDRLTSPEMLELLDQLGRSAPSLTRLLRRAEELERSGALHAVLDLANVVHAAQVSLGDAAISRLAEGLRTAVELMDVLMISGIPDRAPALLNATIAARDAAATDQSFVGPLEFLTAPKEPELQFVLKFMLALARRLPEAMKGDATP